MCAARAVLGGQVRALDMNAGDRPAGERIFRPACAITRSAATIFSSDAVMIVGQKAVTPTRASASANWYTVSVVSPSAFMSRPPYPLTCR